MPNHPNRNKLTDIYIAMTINQLVFRLMPACRSQRPYAARYVSLPQANAVYCSTWENAQ
jgi:hypothetical protein